MNETIPGGVASPASDARHIIPGEDRSAERKGRKMARVRTYPKNPGAGFRSPQQADYAKRLEALVAAGVYLRYREEAVTLRLAKGLTLRPDFMAVRNDGEIVFIEVKGRMEGDAAAKLKMAPELYPEFHFRIAHGRTVKTKKSGRAYWSDPIRHGWEEDDITFAPEEGA